MSNRCSYCSTKLCRIYCEAEPTIDRALLTTALLGVLASSGLGLASAPKRMTSSQILHSAKSHLETHDSVEYKHKNLVKDPRRLRRKLTTS